MLTSLELPRSGAEAAVMAREPGSVVLAGGTIVMPRILDGGHAWTRMVALRRSALDGIHFRGERIELGATATLHELELHPELGFLNSAIRSIGSPNLRNLATVGGNLFVAQPYGDLAVCLLALGAEVQVEDGLARKTVPVEQLFSNAGMPSLVVSVAFTKPPEAGWFYRKAARRTFNAASIVTIAARITYQDGIVSAARIGLGGCGPKPVRARAAEQALVGRPLDRKSVEEAAAVVGADADPFTDSHATSWYRARVLPVHFRRAFSATDHTHRSTTMRSTVVNLDVNGAPVEGLAKPSTTLLAFLREVLGLTATKRGCEQGGCGACTVLVDGKAVMSCLIPVMTVDGADVRTLEGLSNGEWLHPVQEAFLDNWATQCGFCTSGMIMTTLAFLQSNSNPTRSEVIEAISGNICRCTGYEAIIDAVMDAAARLTQTPQMQAAE